MSSCSIARDDDRGWGHLAAASLSMAGSEDERESECVARAATTRPRHNGHRAGGGA